MRSMLPCDVDMSERTRYLIRWGSSVLLALCVLIWYPKNPFAVFAVAAIVLLHGYLLGTKLFPHSSLVCRTGFGGVLFFAIQSIVQTGWFYSNRPLDATGDIWTLLLTVGICQAICLLIVHRQERVSNTGAINVPLKMPLRQRAICVASLLLCSVGSVMYVVIAASRAATLDSIRTPWPLLPPGTLIAIGFLWISAALSAWIARSRALTTIQTVLALFSTTSIAPLVYHLGFGFDGFLHIAGEKTILTSGTLNPKPFYYIGQYVFTTWISRLSGLPIEDVDRWLVPVAAAVLIPASVFLATKNTFRNSLGLLLMPLAPFIATTPQSFAYVLGFVAIFLALECRWAAIHPLAPLLFAFWSMTTHPLAGIPFLCVTFALLLIARDRRRIRRVLAWTCIGVAAAILPIFFYILSGQSNTYIDWNVARIFTIEPWIAWLTSLTPWLENQFIIWPAWTSLVSASLPLLLILGSIGTIAFTQKKERLPYLLLLGAWFALSITAVALQAAGTFSFLIQYERENYAERISLIALLCLLPAAIQIIPRLLNRARQHGAFFALTFLLGIAIIGVAQTANALPRHDALVTGRGWSVGQADINAVRFIDNDASAHAPSERPYTVLANQSVSAAAVSQLGFKRYDNTVFFYPIPTGGPLYKLYLRLTYQQPALETIREAARLGGSSLVYVVINDYWWHAELVGEALAEIADQHWIFGDPSKGPGHSVRVFKFKAP